VRNIYFLLANQFSQFKMSKASNNIAPQKEDNEIVTQLRIMNQRMDQMANEFRDRLEGKRANDHGKVQNRPKRKEFNV